MKIERKDVTKPKITIAVDEIRIKIPLAFSDEQTERTLAFARKVVAKVGPVRETLRGKIHEFKGQLEVTLQRNNKENAYSVCE
jgi:hypothetical protein